MILNAQTVRLVWMDSAKIHANSHMIPALPMQFVHQRVTVQCVNALQDGLEILTLSATNVSRKLIYVFSNGIGNIFCR